MRLLYDWLCKVYGSRFLHNRGTEQTNLNFTSHACNHRTTQHISENAHEMPSMCMTDQWCKMYVKCMCVHTAL